MNHPSDYMPDYRDSQSSDSSNHQVCPLKHTTHTSSHKNKSEIEIVKPKKELQSKNKKKKPAKSTFNKSPAKKKNKTKNQKHSKFDIFVYGGSFYSCGNVDEISNRFKEKQKQNQAEKVMIQDRLRRKQQKCISKIQKYIKSFLLTNATRTPKINQEQKIQLYNMLKRQREEQQQQNLIQQILKKTLQELQQKCQSLLLIYPTQSEVINRWKNVKMHQLMTAQTFLLQQNQINLDIFDLNKQLSLLNEEEFFPQMRQEAHQLQKQIISHIESQEIHNNSKLQDQMVLWVLNRFLAFIECTSLTIKEREDIWPYIAQILQSYQCGYGGMPLISDQVYVQFQKSEIGQNQFYDEENSQRTYLHFFNKSVIDLINETALRFDEVYPAIECLREIISFAKSRLTSDSPSIWVQDSLLDVSHLIFEQLLEDFITDLLDFL